MKFSLDGEHVTITIDQPPARCGGVVAKKTHTVTFHKDSPRFATEIEDVVETLQSIAEDTWELGSGED